MNKTDLVRLAPAILDGYARMKRTLSISILLVAVNLPIGAQEPSEAAAAIVERGANYRIWERPSNLVLPNGKVLKRDRGYKELATGLHYLKDGQWAETREEIELFQDGAIARQGPYSVIFAPNAATAGAIDLSAPDGQRFRSHVLGIGLYDSATANSILVAETKDSIGQLHAPRDIIYPDAFDGVSADLRYSYRKHGFIQDVVLYQKIILPAGFNEATTLLEIWTEFISPPIPERIITVKAGLSDETLIFGSMRIGAGKAFTLAGNGGRERFISVTKRWMVIEGRSFLVESVPVAIANAELDRLGAQQAAVGRPLRAVPNTAFAANLRPFPKPPGVRRPDDTRQIQMATVRAPERGFVADYDLSLSGTHGSLILQGDYTYHITGNITVTNLVIEGGTVVKFDSGVSIQVAAGGSVDCQAYPYLPAVFTSKNDNSAGGPISGSTGSPSPGFFGFPYLYFVEASQLANVRFSYGNPAIYYDIGSGNHSLRHGQFVHCPVGIWIDDTATIKLGNVLMYDLTTAIYGNSWGGTAEHLTVSKCTILASNEGAVATLTLTNCLLVNVTNAGNATLTTNMTVYASGTGVHQTVGAGGAYLATNSPYRDIGTTNITAALLNDLRKGTTYPPIVIESPGVYTNDLYLAPQAQRDKDVLDLGYHYWPLDFVVTGLNLTNATLTASNGVVIGTRKSSSDFAISISQAASFLSEGLPDRPNRIAEYYTVQEQATTNWSVANSEFRLMTGSMGSGAPYISARFTHWSTLAGAGEHFYTMAGDTGTHHFRDSEFHNGDILSVGPTLTFTNSLFNRSALIMTDDLGAITPSIRNCTFRGGNHILYRSSSGTWTFYNNLFDNVASLDQAATLSHDYNAYTTNSTRLSSPAARDILLTVSNITYRVGTLGRFYLPTNLTSHWPLTNTTSFVTNYAGGSTNAQLLGLYHFTCTTAQVKETNTVIEIGYHYVGTDASGAPLDYDGDLIADYLEDVNGNGSLDSGESGWQDADSDDDGVSDYLEILLGRNPLVAGTTNDFNGTLKLRVYTPLR